MLTTTEAAERLGLEPNWIVRRTGIEQRHVVQGESLVDLAEVAARRALERAAVDPTQVDLVVVATVSANVATPAVAPRVAHRLGSTCGAFDISAACAGFLHALSVARAQIEAGHAHRVLVVGAEVLSPLLDWTDRDTAILFADGAGAAVVTPGPHGIRAIRLGSDGAASDALGITGDRIHMDGRAVYRHAVKRVTEGVRLVCADAGWAVTEIDHLVPHQANRRVLEAVARRLNLPADRIVREIADVGNTSSASIPIALDRAARDQRLSDGDRVVLAGLGAGLVWGAAALRWNG